MASVWKHPKSPYWSAQFRGPDAKPINRSTKQKNRKAAQTIADGWEKAAQKARLNELTQAASIKLLGEWMEASTGETLHIKSIKVFLNDWLNDRTSLGRAEATTKRYLSVIENFLKHLGEKRSMASIGSLSSAEIEAWRNAELQTGKGKTTAEFGLKVIRAALNSARRKGLALSNPAEAIEHSGAHSETRDPFTHTEIIELLKVADREWKGMILLGVWCGLRIADAANLTWNCINLAEGVLVFRPSKTRNKEITLQIALHHEVTECLKNLTLGIGGAPLFPTLHGKKAGSHGGLSNEFGRLMSKAGVIIRKGREKSGVGRRFNSKGFHSLRHTMITRFAEAEISADIRRAMAGHSSDAMHQKYVHMGPNSQRSALQKLEMFKP